ncbi:MAG TPA: VOC family protein [Planctomycetota bacterium]|nr:VOC family protein [Planctomycetota bacterium]
MITGVHAILYAKKPEATRKFFKDVLGLPYVDSGEGWLIFALPPSEMGVHPVMERESHELFLMCDDLKATVADLKKKGVKFKPKIHDQPWGTLITMKVPGGGEMGLYQPKHASPPRG